METNADNNLNCKYCDYNTKNKCDFKKHLVTKKHLKKKENYKGPIIEKQHSLVCDICGKVYKYKSSIEKHRKICAINNSNKDAYDKKMEEFIKQQSENMKSLVESLESAAVSNKNVINDLASKVGNTTNNYNTMTINLYLNKECSKAMNLTDFMDSLKLNLEDLHYTRDNGYVKGITNIFVKNLNQLEPTERPIHCSDKKNPHFYIKDENVWTEDTMNEKIDNSIETISKKQILKIKEWESHNPNWSDTEQGANSFMKMIEEIMGSKNKVGNAYETIKKDLGNNLDIRTLIENDNDNN